jgi:hypothetical protein
MSYHNPHEEQIQRIGHELAARLFTPEGKSSADDGWLDQLFALLLEDELLRIQALRFVDVVPALKQDKELSRHFHEYFDSLDTAHLPRLLGWGLNQSRHLQLPSLLGPAVRKAVKTVARKFIAGTDLEEVQEKIRTLHPVSGIRCSHTGGNAEYVQVPHFSVL